MTIAASTSRSQVSAHLMSDRMFFAASAALFAVSAAVTVVWCSSMSAMGGMSMPGGWTMSMTWMRMPDQTWLDAAASFIGMWIIMMVAMMLPASMPGLWRYRAALRGAGSAYPGLLTALAGVGYFLVWIAWGVLAYPLGTSVASVAMQWPAFASGVPVAASVVVVIAGSLQFTSWKARRLACCRGGATRDRRIHYRPTREPSGTSDVRSSNVRMALSHGVRLGLDCSYCCSSLMAILLVIGVMDLRAMAIVTAVITAERIAPRGEQAARVAGAIIVIAGLLMIAGAFRPA